MEDELTGKQVEGSAQCFTATGTDALGLQNSHSLLVPEPVLTRRENLLAIPCPPGGQYGVRRGNPIIPWDHSFLPYAWLPFSFPLVFSAMTSGTQAKRLFMQ